MSLPTTPAPHFLFQTQKAVLWIGHQKASTLRSSGSPPPHPQRGHQAITSVTVRTKGCTIPPPTPAALSPTVLLMSLVTALGGQESVAVPGREAPGAIGGVGSKNTHLGPRVPAEGIQSRPGLET